MVSFEYHCRREKRGGSRKDSGFDETSGNGQDDSTDDEGEREDEGEDDGMEVGDDEQRAASALSEGAPSRSDRPAAGPGVSGLAPPGDSKILGGAAAAEGSHAFAAPYGHSLSDTSKFLSLHSPLDPSDAHCGLFSSASMASGAARYHRRKSFSFLSGAALSANATLANSFLCANTARGILGDIDSPKNFRRIGCNTSAHSGIPACCAPACPLSSSSASSSMSSNPLSYRSASSASTTPSSASTASSASPTSGASLWSSMLSAGGGSTGGEPIFSAENSSSAPGSLGQSFLQATDVQVAGGAAGEDRVQAVCSEANGWVFCGVYDGFNGRDAADFLAVNLYESVGMHLRLLHWQEQHAAQQEAQQKQRQRQQHHHHQKQHLWHMLPPPPPVSFLPASPSAAVPPPSLLRTANPSLSQSMPSLPTVCEEASSALSPLTSALRTIPTADGGAGGSGGEGDNGRGGAQAGAQRVEGEGAAGAAARAVAGADEVNEAQGMGVAKGVGVGDRRIGSESAGGMCCDESSSGRSRASNGPESAANCIDSTRSLLSAEANDPSQPAAAAAAVEAASVCSPSGPGSCASSSPTSPTPALPAPSVNGTHSPDAASSKPTATSAAAASAAATAEFQRAVLRCLQRALAHTERDFLRMVEAEMEERPDLAMVGSCVLLVLLHGRHLFTLNLGDSRALLATWAAPGEGASVSMGAADGSDADREGPGELVGGVGDGAYAEGGQGFGGANGDALAGEGVGGKGEKGQSGLEGLRVVVLSEQHCVDYEPERRRVVAEHPLDASAVVGRRVKGKLRVTRAFGAGYLKSERLNNKLMGIFRVRDLVSPPYVSSVPFATARRVCARDWFVVAGSDGLFDFFTNHEVVQHVAAFLLAHPHGDPAKHMLEQLLLRAAKQAGEPALPPRTAWLRSLSCLLVALTHPTQNDRPFTMCMDIMRLGVEELRNIPSGRRRKYHDDVTVVITLLGPAARTSSASTLH
ncbi:unnamed protein product [Closterium sp. NIES-65]|nr:unnamed protein product [Closterium sp. NIES-65]